MAQNSAGGSGGSSRYRSDVATLTEESTTGVTPEVQITYTSSTEGLVDLMSLLKQRYQVLKPKLLR